MENDIESRREGVTTYRRQAVSTFFPFHIWNRIEPEIHYTQDKRTPEREQKNNLTKLH